MKKISIKKYYCFPASKVTTFKWVGSKGFGAFTFINTFKEDNIECDNEYMTKAFIKKRLCEMVDRSILES